MLLCTGPACDGLPDPCLSQCELAAGVCEERPFEAFADYEETLAVWQAQAADWACDATLPFIVAGTCSSGGRFLSQGGGFTTLTHYFEPATGDFIALATTTDVVAPPCNGRGYFPRDFACGSGTVTEVICGTLYDEGDEFVVP